MPIVNLTKRALTLLSAEGDAVEVAPDARHVGLVSVGEVEHVEDGGRRFALSVRRVTGLKGMPAPEPGALYVVEPEVAMALAGERADVAFVAETSRQPLSAGGTVRVSVLRRVVPAIASIPS
ncbi:MAG: hypothetical protein AAGK21_01470 [Bacteroidota bacterium]